GWLVPVFVLWVNLDAWFLLGLAVVVLHLSGQLANETQQVARPAAADVRGAPAAGWVVPALALVTGAAVLACLVNPYHVQVFLAAWQTGLGEGTGSLGPDAFGADVLRSPFQPEFFQSGLGLCAAGIAYWLLVALSLAAVLLSFPDRD